MSKRNFILFIIILTIIIAIVFGILYLYQPAGKTGTVADSVNFIANFLPFGKNKTPTNNTNSNNTPADISGLDSDTINNPGSILKKVSSFPVAGYIVFNKERIITDTITETTTKSPQKIPTEFALNLRYVNKITGNIYQTFAGILSKEYLGADSVGTSAITGAFLPENITDISISPDTTKDFYLFNTGDNTAGISFSPQTSTKVQVFDSPFTGWLSFWPNKNMITITTKPSYNTFGYMYAIDPDKKDLTKILGDINGLNTLTSPDGTKVLYSDNNLSLNVFDVGKKNTSLLGVKTLPEKCVWASTSDAIYCAVPKFIDRGGYPDSWYQGEVSFSDQIWKIDIQNGNTSMVSNLTSLGGDIDAIKLSLDENQNYLFFLNKKDSYLWELKLK